MKTQITTTAYNEIIKTIGSRVAESGGILLGPPDDSVITHFVFDKNSHNTNNTYRMHTPSLNNSIDRLYEECNVVFKGLGHSHPRDCIELSPQDEAYFLSQFKNFEVDKFFVPLVFSAKDGEYDFIPYVIHRDGTIEKTTLEILPDDYKKYTTPNLELDKVQKATELILEKVTVLEKQATSVVVYEEPYDEDPFIYFLNNFPFKKFRIFLFSFFLLVLTLVISVFLLDLSFYFPLHKFLK